MDASHEPFSLVNVQSSVPMTWVTDITSPVQQRLSKRERDRSVTMNFYNLPFVTIGMFRYVDDGPRGVLFNVTVRGTRVRFAWEW